MPIKVAPVAYIVAAQLKHLRTTGWFGSSGFISTYISICQAILNGGPPDEAMDVDKPEEKELVPCHNTVAIEKILAFGRDLQALFTKLTASKPNEQLHTLLQVWNYVLCAYNYNIPCKFL